MTAYANDEQKKEGAYGKAVKATLAATLAAGMVPAAAAFAQPADEAAEGEYDVDLLALDAKDAWEKGEFAVADNFGTAVEFKTDATGAVLPVEFEYDGRAHYLVPKTVDPVGPGAVEDLTDDKLYNVTYQSKDGSTTYTNLADIKNPGEYKVTVAAKSANTDYSGATKVFEFKIVAAENKLVDAEFYQVGDDGDFSDKTFEYKGAAFSATGAKGELALVLNGKKLVANPDGRTGDYKSIAFYSANGTEVTSSMINAGTYTAVITANDDTTVKKTVTISKIDLAKAKYAFTGATTDFTARTVSSINGISTFAGKGISDLFDTALTSMPAVDDKDALGEYVWSVAPKANPADEDTKAILANFEGVGKAVDINAKTEITTANFKYGKDQLANMTIDRSQGDAEFDLAKISVLRDGTNKLDKSFYTVTVLDQAGNEVDAAKLKEAGVWTVKVTVDSKATNWAYYGEASAKVTVLNGEVQGDDIVFALDGKVVSGTVNKTYDGEDLLAKVEASVKLGDKELVEGEDYVLKAVDADNKAVDSIVEAGTYTVSVESDKYDLKAGENSFTLVVDPADAKFVRIAPASLMLEGEDGTKVVYTGEAIAPALQYTTDATLDAETEWKDLPADAAALTFEYAKKANGTFKPAKEMKELGFYKLKASDANSEDSITFTAPKFQDFIADTNDDGEPDAAQALVYEVVKGKVYADVKPGDWFYQDVYDAQKAGYMFGIGDSEIFAPNQTTTRAMAATVLSRMAVEGGVSGAGYNNPFTDVVYNGNDDDPWYAGTVLWAAETGIVSGYEQADGTAQFRPEKNVTRAEFCVMMQRYAAATDQGVALEAGEADSILAKYDDGAAVPAWCKDAVAWAVKNEVFGGYSVLNPDGDITRAEMAKMAVAFQAEPLK